GVSARARPRPPLSSSSPCTTLFRSRWGARTARGSPLLHEGVDGTRTPPDRGGAEGKGPRGEAPAEWHRRRVRHPSRALARRRERSEEHTSELQSRENLVCRLLLEKK